MLFTQDAYAVHRLAFVYNGNKKYQDYVDVRWVLKYDLKTKALF